MKSVFVSSKNPDLTASVQAAVTAADSRLGFVDAFRPPTGADLLILDAALHADELAAIFQAANYAPGGSSAPPNVIFVSETDSLAARLTAVRAGAGAFFPLPLEPAWFAESLRELARLPDEQAFRALVIDDSATILGLFQTHLEGAGFDVQTAVDARSGYELAHRFNPDVVLLDIVMPEMNGLELLGVLRQHPVFTGTQVILISADASVSAQLDAMSHGAQNYLVKPVLPADLVRAALNNAARARAIRNLVWRDPLTGLLNHRRIHDLAEREFIRHQRNAKPFSVVMLDLDYFKRINDEFGHATGDLALKTFSAGILSSARRSDYAGRMGGDEFMLLLPETDKQAAGVLIDKLRAQALQVQSPRGPVPITFSCGIADSQDRASFSGTTKAADEALYEAKRLGRRRTVMA